MLSQHIWLQLSLTTRQRIASFLGITRSGTTQVEYNGTQGRIVSDGFTQMDLSKITTELLKQELGEETLVALNVNTDNFYDMFNELVRRVELPIVEFPQPVAEKPLEPIVEPYTPPIIEHTVLANVEKPVIKAKKSYYKSKTKK
jgi:hypothetical protein